MRAMILAAGKGTRLLPLTEKLPKALVPVAGKPMIHYGLDLLARHGISEVMINLHHLGSLIEEALGDGSDFGLRISYSREDELLDTGGGIKRAASFFQRKRFLVMNCDFLARIDLHELLAWHRERGGDRDACSSGRSRHGSLRNDRYRREGKNLSDSLLGESRRAYSDVCGRSGSRARGL
jgi:NDP-sugar pyrophosphorylase family protein